MVQNFNFMLVWVSYLWFQNTRRVFAKTQSRYSLLGLKPMGNLALQIFKKEKTKKPILATRLPPTAGAPKGDPPACEDPSPSSADSWGWILIPYIIYPHSIRNRRVFDPLPDSLTIARGECS